MIQDPTTRQLQLPYTYIENCIIKICNKAVTENH